MLTSTSSSQIVQSVQVALLNLRNALEAVADLYQWSSAQTAADLEATGLALADAEAIQSALADANQLTQLYNGDGLGTYTLPYTFGASQREVIGPQ